MADHFNTGDTPVEAASVHTHAEADVTNLTTDLAAKAAKASNLSDLAAAATARTNLGLGSAALLTADNALPWIVDVDPTGGTPISHVNWNTITIDNTSIGCGRLDSTAAQNNEVNFDVVLGAGTWTFELIHTTISNVGIYTVTLDGASMTSLGGSVDTIDGYSAAATRNVRNSITGIVVAASGKKRLKLKMATTNPSSGQYQGAIQKIQLRRTA